MKEKTLKSRQERIDIVNAIIKEIASRGLKFFTRRGQVEVFWQSSSGGLWFGDFDGVPTPVYMCVPTLKKPIRWSHGGTMWALAHDFKHFIITGKESNGKNGYGGLYCPHWGYGESDMEAIRDLARSLGYLTDKSE